MYQHGRGGWFMLLGIDRVLIAIPDLARSTLALEAALGLTAAGGGYRTGSGSASSIIPVGDGLLELLAVQDPRALRSDNRGRALAALVERGGGLAGFGLLTDDLQKAIEAAWEETVPTSGPHPVELQLFNGAAVHWHTGEVAGDPWGRRMPFLVEYAVEQERAVLTPPFDHPLGVARIAGVTICTRLVFEAVDAFRRYLRVEPQALSEQRALIPIGTSTVEFLAPEAAAVDWALDTAPEQEGLFGVTLAVHDMARAADVLERAGTPYVETARGRLVLSDPARMGNARFRLAAAG
jgi:hypothetical protein